MRPAGLREVERAKADGRWDAAYEGQRSWSPTTCGARSPRPRAPHEFFAALGSHNRYAILYRIQDAKQPETRTRRIEQFVAMLARGETLHP